MNSFLDSPKSNIIDHLDFSTIRYVECIELVSIVNATCFDKRNERKLS